MSKRMPVGNSLNGWMQQIWVQARMRRGLVGAAGALSALAPALALANPSGGQVVAGSATIGNAGSNGVIVNQSSQRAAINWQQFSIGSNEYVQFNQPNSSSVVLNRVTGSNPSSIFGEIKANGQVFLINPNGILFAPGSTLDVSSLTASTLDISDSDFMAGRYVFSKDSGAPDATVVNRGNITVTQGGYVVLAGDYVENDGVIQAQSGKVLLAAGGGATLTLDNSGGLISYKIDAPTLARLAGVTNAGTIVADGGVVVMTADVANALTATAVNNSGLITAHSVSQQGGEIVLLSQGGDIENSGTLDASATQAGVAGGMVIIRGDEHTQLTDTSVIDAEGDGAKGGFIELSGHTLDVRGRVTPGKGGSLLIDPASINIVSGGASGHSPASDSIGTTFIANELNANQNVTIVASIKIKNTTGTGITALTGDGNLTMAIGSVSGPSCIGGAAACVGTGTPTIGHAPGGGTINLTGLPINIAGNLAIDAAGNADSGGQITTVGLKANSVSLTADNITVNGNITANGGDVVLHGHSGNNDVITVTGTVTADNGAFRASFSNEGGAGIGSVNLKNVTAEGIFVMASHINVTGTLHAVGSGEAAASHRDVVLKSQHEFTSAGGASIAVGKLVSDHGSVTLSASGNGASVGKITVAGNITASQNVKITAVGAQAGEGKVDVTGSISAGRDVTINAPQISTGAISAGRSVDLNANGNLTHASITVNGAIHGHSNVSIDAHGSYGGNVKVTGAVIAGNGSIAIQADNTRGVSGGNISVGNISAADSVTIFSRGGGTATPVLNIGSITAGSEASINVQFLGSTAPVAVQTGAINAAAINIQVKGHGAKFTAVSLKASGISSGTGTVECGCHNGFINGRASGSHGSASFKVTGTVKSMSGDVSISAGHGAINTGNITAGHNVLLKGNDIQVGSVTAGSFVSITGNSGSAIAHITATGLVKGKGVFVSANGSHSAGNFGGSIDLAGGVTATGVAGGSVSTGEVGIHIKASTATSVKMKITTGALQAASGSISVIERGASGGIVINGTVNASNGNVDIKTQGDGGANGGGISVGSITATHGTVDLQASNSHGGGANLKVNGGITAKVIGITTSASTGGNITVTGGLTATAGHIFVGANSSSSEGHGGSGGNIKVTGATKASNGSVQFFAHGAGHSGGNINIGKVTAGQDVSIVGSYAGTAEAGTQIKILTGNVKGRSVFIEATGPAPIINTGTLTATGTVSSAGVHDYVKVLLSPVIATRGQGSISIGTVTGNGDVSIQALGGAVNTAAISAGTGGDVDVSGSNIHVGGAITAIGGSVCLTGSSVASHATKIKVTGTIKSGMVQIKASPGSSALQGASIDLAKVSSSLSGGIMIEAQTSAAVNTQITIGSLHAGGTGHIDVTQKGASGGITITGPITTHSGGVGVTASGGGISVAAITAGGQINLRNDGNHGGGIKVNGNLTGTSVSIEAESHSGANIAVLGKIISSGHVHITASAGANSGGNVKVTGLISASSGSVTIHATGAGESGGRIKLGSVSAAADVSIAGHYTGTSPGFTLQTGKVTGKSVTITMTGKDPSMTVAGVQTTGSSGHSCECAHGFVQLQLHPTSDSGSMSITGAIKTAHGNVTLNASDGVINLGNNTITTGGSGGVSVQGGRVHLGGINAGGGISIAATAVGSHAGSITAGATTLWTGKYVNINLTGSSGAKGKIAIGAVTANGTAGSSSNSHGGKLKITASMGSKKVTVTTGTLTAASTITAQIQNGSGSASFGKLNAPKVNVTLANGNLTVGQLVHAGASLTASNGSITDTTTGSLDLVGDKFNTTHGVHLKAGTNITLTNDSFGSGGLSASAGGKLVETSSGILDVSAQVLKAKQLVLSAATIELGASKLTASSIQLSATSINNASGNGTITAAKGTLHATHGIFLVGENIVVSGAGPLISAASVDIDKAVVTGTGVLSVVATGNLDASSLHVTAGGLNAHGGSVSLTDAKIASTKAVTIKSGKDVSISGAQIAGSAVSIAAGRDITDGSVAGALIGGAGKLTLKAQGDVQLSGEALTIGAGGGSISAKGSLSFAKAVFTGAGAATLHAGTDIAFTGATLTLGGITLDAVGGSIDLTGATATVTGQMALQAKKDIILSGVHITTAVFTANASGTIHNGGAVGAITADAIEVDAKQDINLSDTVITLGNGGLTGVTGDTTLLQLLAAAGLKPSSATPNGAFIAGGSLTLGTMDITGKYLVLQGSSISILGPVTAPTSGLLVEVRPTDPTASIGVEGQPGKGQTFNISNQGFFALFPGDTIVIGDDAESGNVLIGDNGPFTLANGTNLLFDTSGTITGLGKITSTGLVGSLETIAGEAGDNNIVTAGEIDPSTTTTSLGDQTDKKHLGGNQNGANGEGQGGSITQDTGTSSVCH